MDMKNLIIKIRYSIVALILTILGGVAASAATPWEVNPANYRYDMSLYLDFTFADGKMDYSKYDVAAFVGDECRGVAEVMSLSNAGSCLYLRARSNSESGEKLSFAYRNKSTGEVLPVEGVSIDFVSNERLGFPSAPHVVEILFYHDVAISASAGGSVSYVGGRLAEGSTFDVAAVAAEGYHFVKWDDDNTDNPRTVSVATDDISLKALFEPTIYKLTYSVDGAEYRSYDVAYGSNITAEAAPEKEGYTFSGWSELPPTMPAHDVAVSGKFTINSYRAVFKIGDEVVDTKTVVYGAAIEAAVAPEKEGYTFSGWSEIPTAMPAHDIEIMGSYTVNVYKLTYSVDGAEYRSYDVAYGSNITAAVAPEKEGYTFSGWSELPPTMPAHDVAVSGKFTINSYRLLVYLDDEVYMDTTIQYGEPVSVSVPEVGDGKKFEGWDIEIPQTMPAHDVTVRGTTSIVTSLSRILSDDMKHEVYDLQGRRTKVASHGIYIINGRKVLK